MQDALLTCRERPERYLLVAWGEKRFKKEKIVIPLNGQNLLLSNAGKSKAARRALLDVV
jgi:hypothetical protein